MEIADEVGELPGLALSLVIPAEKSEMALLHASVQQTTAFY